MLYTITTDKSNIFYHHLHIHIQAQALQYYYTTLRAGTFKIDIFHCPNWWLSVVHIIFFHATWRGHCQILEEAMEINGNAIRCAVCESLPVQLPSLETPALLALQHRQRDALFYSQSVSSSSSEPFSRLAWVLMFPVLIKTTGPLLELCLPDATLFLKA